MILFWLMWLSLQIEFLALEYGVNLFIPQGRLLHGNMDLDLEPLSSYKTKYGPKFGSRDGELTTTKRNWMGTCTTEEGHFEACSVYIYRKKLIIVNGKESRVNATCCGQSVQILYYYCPIGDSIFF